MSSTRRCDEFNDGYFFESHETLEDLWMVTPLPERTLFQGIIQVAAAFVHVARGEYPGIFKLLDAAREKLEEFAPAALRRRYRDAASGDRARRGPSFAVWARSGIGAWDLAPRPEDRHSDRAAGAMTMMLTDFQPISNVSFYRLERGGVKPMNILLAEDDLRLARAVRRVFEEETHHVEIVGDGQDGAG